MRFRSVAAVLLMVLLAACSPDYNWREVSLADGQVVAIFPDKPREQTKTLPFAGHDIPFTLSGTVLNDTVFAVGHAPLPPEVGQDAEQRTLMYRQIVQSFYGNFGLTPPEALPEPGTRFSIEGQGPKGLLRLEGVVWMHSGSVTEGLVTAPAGSFPQAQADEFLRAIKAPGG
ncbi:hypothetical protein [Neopusillimonas aromaticivorans]|uniref:hypothetical protein n=1 Tax=Neopusillimonas aromaticivorans TaxID=2979868 RepID=UPI0025920FB8|nr:hypothetical protein [Neopusillimonas aromaticivorans]WJJ94348.1 hypothetical protein N7E01_04845 [Neopusillimonas aromaticivorans]